MLIMASNLRLGDQYGPTAGAESLMEKTDLGEDVQVTSESSRMQSEGSFSVLHGVQESWALNLSADRVDMAIFGRKV